MDCTIIMNNEYVYFGDSPVNLTHINNTCPPIGYRRTCGLIGCIVEIRQGGERMLDILRKVPMWTVKTLECSSPYYK